MGEFYKIPCVNSYYSVGYGLKEESWGPGLDKILERMVVRKEQSVKAQYWAFTEADIGIGILIRANSFALARAYSVLFDKANAPVPDSLKLLLLLSCKSLLLLRFCAGILITRLIAWRQSTAKT